jgi:hypothetical protein
MIISSVGESSGRPTDVHRVCRRDPAAGIRVQAFDVYLDERQFERRTHVNVPIIHSMCT